MSGVAITREGSVTTLTLDRPGRRNAFSPATMTGLTAAVREADADPLVRVVVLAGDGPTFCAGADIEWMRAGRDADGTRNLEEAEALRDGFEALDTCGKAVIARVHGAAIGGGAGLVACADVAVAADDTRFAFAEVRLGLVPATIAPYVVRAIGPGAARSLFTSGRAFDADEALRLGLVHHVVPPASLDTAVREVVDLFLQAGPEAIASCKRMIRDATSSLQLPDLPQRITEARISDEGREGLDAFLEKRSPSWAQSTDS
ncbi:MAG: enoyl-CoA hydratase-related protein [Actinomycetota bacterium]